MDDGHTIDISTATSQDLAQEVYKLKTEIGKLDGAIADAKRKLSKNGGDSSSSSSSSSDEEDEDQGGKEVQPSVSQAFDIDRRKSTQSVALDLAHRRGSRKASIQEADLPATV